MHDATPPANISGPRSLPPALQAGLLVMIAGYADAIGFLQHRAFAGQMTGNTILLAISLAEAGWPQAGFYLAVIATLLLGVAVSGSRGWLAYWRGPRVFPCGAGLCSRRL